jgi:3-phenylpropionate/cinnamic acid dioxygenase small subunit
MTAATGQVRRSLLMLSTHGKSIVPLLVLITGALTSSVQVQAQVPAELADRIAMLEAREEIRNLIYEYGRTLDTRDFIAFSNLFAEQAGTWDGGMGIATGRNAIFELMDSTIGHAPEPVEPRSHHVMTNIRIEVVGDAATATTKWIFVVPSASGEPRWQFLGHYDDEFVRQDGKWYFLRRKAFTDIPVQE